MICSSHSSTLSGSIVKLATTPVVTDKSKERVAKHSIVFQDTCSFAQSICKIYCVYAEHVSQCSKERDSYSFNSSLPNIISSTEITRLVMAKEIKNILPVVEDAQEQHLKDMAAMRKKVGGVFRVNRALAAFQAENF